MPDKILDYYIYAFTNLNTGGGKIKESAPHKPLILLSVIQGYGSNLLTDNTIPITPELTSIFKSNWNNLVTTGHTLSFAMPFFRLKNEDGNWWQLAANPGCELWVQTGDLSNFSSLSNAVSYAEIDPNLAQLLLNDNTRTILRQALLDKYFPGKSITIASDGNATLNEIKREMLEETPIEYSDRIKRLKKRLNAETYEIEIHSRETFFRREVVKLYDDRCCITGVRVSAPYSFSMVDACHIVPFYKTFNNHPTNGIALCPNLHRAFDKGVISIDDDYSVIVSPTFVENDASIYSLKALAGQKIELPRSKDYLPDVEALEWHRKNTFKR
ncbi:HNH endonuclease [Spirosoma fluviale]|uniref:Putative restriction endonuclease n=1 Tax=Spirosoma fluviale TaxID=1597977 RepID=A0A286G1T5_9BACT|nr:HNH endonuclease [Spirosoma fluviale]SOD88944.1 putative restriction endonuclease [Spirosoma fluviale]